MAGPSSISQVGFSFGSSEDNVRNSCGLATRFELYGPNGMPVQGGVYDTRYGTTDHSHLCSTCGHNKKLCTGHRGHINLKVAVAHPLAIAEIRKWLKIICFKCGTLLIDQERYQKIPIAKRLNELSSGDTAGARCKTCATVHPKIVRDNEDNFSFIAVYAPDSSERIYPDAMLAIFSRISAATFEIIGKHNTTPVNYILKSIVVPPNTIRPVIRSFTGKGSVYDDLTNLLQQMIKRNDQFGDKLPDAIYSVGTGVKIDSDLANSISNFQQIYFDFIKGGGSTNATQGNTGKRGLVMGTRAVQSIVRKWLTKTGRLRGDLLGKRVSRISRDTIVGNSELPIDTVEIPLQFARKMQVEETVQEYNRNMLMTFFMNGRRQYPGSTIIIKKATGEMHDVANMKFTRLEVGDIIYRDVVDGDLVMFNRAPTLERSSMGAHTVRVLVNDPNIMTYRFNVLGCINYNADFDGDQMHLYAFHSIPARAEAMILSAISNWFISTKTSGPVNGQVQDSVVGHYELTKASVRLNKMSAMSLFAGSKHMPRFDEKSAAHIYGGRDIITMALAKTPINFRRAPTSYSDVYAPYINYDKDEIFTVIEQGVMLSGVLDKKSIGQKCDGGIYHIISREYGSQSALDAIYAMQQLVLHYLQRCGLTTSTVNILPSAEALSGIQTLVSSVELEADTITERLLTGRIVPPIDSTVREFYEEMQINALKIPESDVLRLILGSIGPKVNNFFGMISSGSKGSNPNLIHICGAIGQTTINGKRMEKNFALGRTLPYFPRYCTEPAAHGFVASNYINGMTSSEFIFQAMNGRFDLINKALTTATTGYFMRKGIMNNQSNIVDNFRCVVMDTKIVQLLYGDDGIDSRKLEKISYKVALMTDTELKKLTATAEPTAAVITAASAAAVALALQQDRDEYRRIMCKNEAANFNQPFSTEVLLPVNVKRIVDNIYITFQLAEDSPVSPGLADRIAIVKKLCDDLPYVLINEIQKRRQSAIPEYLRMSTKLLAMSVRAELCPKRIAPISNQHMEIICTEILHKYSSALVDYGSAVGILAVQSISQPITQYMLDSHHRSVAGGTSSASINRVAEIYGSVKVEDEQTPMMLLPIRQEILEKSENPQIIATAIANSIELIELQACLTHYDIILEPISGLIYPPYLDDTVWIKKFYETHPLVTPPSDLTNWCIRFSIDKSVLVLKALGLDLIILKLRAKHPTLFIVHTPEPVGEITIRVWIRSLYFKQEESIDKAKQMLSSILKTTIRGIPGIIRTTVEKVVRMSAAKSATDGELVKENRYIIRTVGTNLFMASLHTAIDPTGIISNSVGDTCRMFGIEITRKKIINETRAFMEDETPNMRHLNLYGDNVTRTGVHTNVERAGLSAREYSNVLLRMSNSAPVQVITDAAVNNTKSQIYGIAAPQVLGTAPKIGSLYNRLVVNEAFVAANYKSVDSVLDSL